MLTLSSSAAGVCQPSSYSCPGTYKSGLCPGSSSIQCCQESTPSCTGSNQCQQTSLPCNGTYASGLCPGGSDIRCCQPSSGGSCSYVARASRATGRNSPVCFEMQLGDVVLDRRHTGQAPQGRHGLLLDLGRAGRCRRCAQRLQRQQHRHRLPRQCWLARQLVGHRHRLQGHTLRTGRVSSRKLCAVQGVPSAHERRSSECL